VKRICIRFLNRKTLVPGRLILDDKDQFHLEFLASQDGKTRTKRIGFHGEEIRSESGQSNDCPARGVPDLPDLPVNPT
jgi:hypothetical protein